jgi:hypothetical protein
MGKLKCIATIFLVAVSYISHAQNEIDALRYSQSFFGGTARSMGMAGSFGALGADPSSITTNPAGLARFSKGHFSISMGGRFNNMRSEFSGTESSITRSSVPLNSVALVINAPRINESGWKSVQTTFSFNRLADFTATRFYEGKNYNSLLDVFASDGYLVPTTELYSQRPFTTNLAWQTYAIDDQVNSFFETYYSPRLNLGDTMYHSKNIQSKGGISEYSFGLSGNYNNKLYIGGSLNLLNIRYFENNSHQEKVIDPDGFSLQSFNYDFNLNSRGIGANLKLGLIYILSEEFRIGIAYHTPTMLRFKEDYNADMTAVHDFGVVDTPSDFKPTGDFQYRFRNPGKWLFSLAYVHNKRLATNVDFELVNYGGAAFRSSSIPGYQYTFLNENLMVSELYRRTLNTRIGLEYAVTPEWFVRGGYAIYGRAFDNSHRNEAGANLFFTAGVGYRKGQLVLDLAYVNHRAKSEYYAFTMQGIDQSDLKTVFRQNAHQLVLTLGFRFN